MPQLQTQNPIKLAFIAFHEKRRLCLCSKIAALFKKRVKAGWSNSAFTKKDCEDTVIFKDSSLKEEYVFEAGWKAAEEYFKQKKNKSNG